MADKETHTSKKKKARLEKIQKKALESQRIRVHNQVLAYQKKHKKERKIAPRDSFISLQHINKIYDNHVQAVFDFNLEIKQHEFIVFVGPSGCGKSTTLRMIAGLESITSGDLYIDKVYSNDIESKNRDIAMVFQSYALYPNLSVAGNMAFGLKIRKVPTMLLDEDGKPVKKINKSVINDYKRELYSLEQYINECKEEEKPAIQKDIDELKETVEYLEKTPIPVYVQKHLDKEVIAKRVDEALEILQIKEYADRKPKALSGGQCQRVALGRAIVRKSKVFLMDEPLSNLDAKLRVQMRSEIVKLHKKLNATTIYVTHDQTEAMTMASRIVVMSKGVVQQVGTPLEIYNHPANLFVATFIGSPSMNLYNGQFEGESFTFRKEDDLTEESVKMPAEFGKRVKEFYKNELVSYKQEKEQILASFVERNDLLAKIEADQNIQDEAKREAAIAQHKAELEAVIKSNSRLSFLEEAIEKYEEYCASNKYETVFGIRPEDIYDKSAKTTHVEAGAIIKGKITVSELLGHEYFIHLDFEGKDLVSKISSKQIIDSGEYIELVLDLQRSHIFDRVSGKLIY